ncbi:MULTISPECIES: GNAT family N-acetyltransferase [unclassified Luteococcus]|uniref:GNAT family N-acetyltransferase n=1 Tax=unclassified Luteococcus TaxID=2639923 RepID=UPI00313B7521
MDFTICQIAVPSRDSFDPSWVMAQTDAILLTDATEVLGEPDFHLPLALRVHGLRRQVDEWQTILVAVAGLDTAALPHGEDGLPLLSWEADQAPTEGRVLGLVSVSGGITDNVQLAELSVIVAVEHRRNGIGSALLAAAETLASQRGCRTVQSWSDHHRPEPGEDHLVPPTGFGAVPLDRAGRFAQASGYGLEQCERHSVCELPGDVEQQDRLWAEALPHALDYQIRTIAGRIPDDLVDRYAQLLEHFTEQMPNAGLDVEPERWDADRIRRGEAQRAAAGREAVTTVALHRQTQELVAATDITTDGTHPAVCFQQMTVVDSRHRGHRLGLLVKIANHRAVHQHHPERRRVHTWNAGENSWMLAINDQLGYRERIVEAAWQKRLGRIGFGSLRAADLRSAPQTTF